MVDLYRAVPDNGHCTRNDVVLASEIKRESPFPFRFGPNKFAFPELETINRAAYWDYQRERVYVKSRKKSTRKREPHTDVQICPYAQYDNRMPLCFVLPGLQIQRDQS